MSQKLRLQREQLNAIVGNDPDAVRVFERVFTSLNGLVESIEVDLATGDLIITAPGGRIHLLDDGGAAPTCPYPVGGTYVQFPGFSDPGTLWGSTTWQKVFDDEGVFFRTEDGEVNAFAFGGGIQAGAIQNITGYINAEGGGYGELGYAGGAFYSELPNGRAATGIMGYSNYGRARMDVSRVVPTAAEVRPKNRTIRVWERVG